MAALAATERAMLTQTSRHRKAAADAKAKKQVCELEAARARQARDDAVAWREVQAELERKSELRALEKRQRKAAQMEAIGADLDFIKRYRRKQERRLANEWSTKQTVAHILRLRGALEQRGIYDMPPVPGGLDLHHVNPLGDPRVRQYRAELDLFVELRMREEEKAHDFKKELEKKAKSVSEEADDPGIPEIGSVAASFASSPRHSPLLRSANASPSNASPTPPEEPSVGAVVAIMHQTDHMKSGGEQWLAAERTKLREWALAGIPNAPRAPAHATARSASVATRYGGVVRGRPICVESFGLRSTSTALRVLHGSASARLAHREG
jgi:hypothetical protein